jgi:hypothetical protein
MVETCSAFEILRAGTVLSQSKQIAESGAGFKPVVWGRNAVPLLKSQYKHLVLHAIRDIETRVQSSIHILNAIRR